VEEGIVPELTVLGGGVSNIVIKVKTPNRAYVVKQALPRLRVQDEWLADRSRILREAACLRSIRRFVGEDAAPDVLLEDRENFACVIECAPDGSHTWKQDLLSGLVEPAITVRVASILATLHRRTRNNDQVKAEFGDVSNFVELRLDPYLVTIGKRHPDLKPAVDEVIEFLLSSRTCLVHGDYSPKNFLILPDARLWVIDCEVAHYGNPVFDIAFCVNHLLLKTVHLSSRSHLREAERLWALYWRQVGELGSEREAVRTLAGLMLARVDGKSPAEYLNDGSKESIRKVARRLVGERVDKFDELCSAVSGVLE